MRFSTIDIFRIGVCCGFDVRDAKDARDVGKALRNVWYPEGVKSRAGEIIEDQGLVSAITQGRKIIEEVIG